MATPASQSIGMPQEIRHALRLLARNPGFTAIAALSLALGIGTNSAIFSLTDALLLRPLPVLRPSRVVTISTDPQNGTLGIVIHPGKSVSVPTLLIDHG